MRHEIHEDLRRGHDRHGNPLVIDAEHLEPAHDAYDDRTVPIDVAIPDSMAFAGDDAGSDE